MKYNKLLQYARNTTLHTIDQSSGITEHEDRPPTTTYTLRLEGTMHNLKAAQHCIIEAAKEKRFSEQVHTVILKKATYRNTYNMDVAYNGDIKDGAITLLSLVHKATQCDIGAKIETYVYKEDASISAQDDNEEDGDWWRQPEERAKPREYVFGIIVDCTDIENNEMLRPYVIDYLERELKAMSETFGGEKPIKHNPYIHHKGVDESHYTKIYQYANQYAENESSAEINARMLAEHVAGTLGLFDTSVDFDRRGYAEKKGLC